MRQRKLQRQVSLSLAVRMGNPAWGSDWMAWACASKSGSAASTSDRRIPGLQEKVAAPVTGLGPQRQRSGPPPDRHHVKTDIGPAHADQNAGNASASQDLQGEYDQAEMSPLSKPSLNNTGQPHLAIRAETMPPAATNRPPA